jgi:hypothetical protein
MSYYSSTATEHHPQREMATMSYTCPSKSKKDSKRMREFGAGYGPNHNHNRDHNQEQSVPHCLSREEQVQDVSSFVCDYRIRGASTVGGTGCSLVPEVLVSSSSV